VDWYINQLRHATNNAGTIDLLLSADKIMGDKRNALRYDENSKFKNRTLDLKEVVKFMGNDNAEAKNLKSGENYIPTTKFKITVDSAAIVNNDLVADELKDDVVSLMTFDLKNKTLLKNDLMVLDIVASNISKRPICFAITVSPDAFLGMEKYFMQTAMAHRLTPIEFDGNGYNKEMNTNVMYDLMINNQEKFTYGGLEKGKPMYIDPSSLGSAMTSKYINYQQLAGKLIEEKMNLEAQGKQMLGRDSSNAEFKEVGDELMQQTSEKEQMALTVLDMMMKKFPSTSLPYDYNMINAANYYQLLGQNETAIGIVNSLSEICMQDLEYYYKMYSAGPVAQQQYSGDTRDAERCLGNGINIAKKAGDTNLADGLQKRWDMLRAENNIPNEKQAPKPQFP
jgi:hypothetical protein